MFLIVRDGRDRFKANTGNDGKANGRDAGSCGLVDIGRNGRPVPAAYLSPEPHWVFCDTWTKNSARAEYGVLNRDMTIVPR